MLAERARAGTLLQRLPTLTKPRRCGSGRHAYEFLDAGFPHVSGYDVQDYVKLRLPADRDRFRFDPTSGDGTEYPAMTEVPWPDNTFDFVFATQVFEHVSDQELA